MYEERFKKSLSYLIKYENYENMSNLLTVLRSVDIKFIETSTYTYKPNQYWQDVEIRVPIPLLNEARGMAESLKKPIGELYQETSEFALRSILIKPKLLDDEFEEIVEHDVVFNEIRETIIAGINDAKYSIWVVVAWFTDQLILDALDIKKRAGLDIKIITSDEDSNKYLMNKLESYELYKIPLSGYWGKNRLHDKFCIIDLQYVMHGSYNWSKNAEFNDETWSTALDREFVGKFAEEFIRLKNI